MVPRDEQLEAALTASLATVAAESDAALSEDAELAAVLMASVRLGSGSLHCSLRRRSLSIKGSVLWLYLGLRGFGLRLWIRFGLELGLGLELWLDVWLGLWATGFCLGLVLRFGLGLGLGPRWFGHGFRDGLGPSSRFPTP